MDAQREIRYSPKHGEDLFVQRATTKGGGDLKGLGCCRRRSRALNHLRLRGSQGP